MSAPAVVVGAPFAPAASLLSVESLPAAVNLRGPTASLTLRSLTLLNLPLAGLYSASATNASSNYPPDSTTSSFAPPDDLRRRRRSTRRLAGTDADLNYNRRLRQESEQPADQDVTQGMPPGFANFTSCLWMLDFDRTKAFAQGGVPKGAPHPALGKLRTTSITSGVGSSTGSNATDGSISATVQESDPGALPRAVLHSVTLVVPPAELALIAWVYVTGSTGAITDPWVAHHVRQALLGESVLAGGETSLRWLVERVTAAKEAACLSGGGGGGGGGDDDSRLGVTRMTFARWSWCGVRGVDVTLTSEQPALPPGTAFSLREQQPLVLPVNYSCGVVGAGGAGPNPSPGASPSAGSGYGSTVGGSGGGHTPATLPSEPTMTPAAAVITGGGGDSVLPQLGRRGAGAATPLAVGLGVGVSLLAVALLGAAAATLWLRRRPYGSSPAFGDAVKPTTGQSSDSNPSCNSGTGAANGSDGSRGLSDTLQGPSALSYDALTTPAPTVNHPRCGGRLASTSPDVGHAAVADNRALANEVFSSSNGSSCYLVDQVTAAGGAVAVAVAPQHDHRSAPATPSTHPSTLGHCQRRRIRLLNPASSLPRDQLPPTSLLPPLPPKSAGAHLKRCMTKHQSRSLTSATPAPRARPTTASPAAAAPPEELVDQLWQSRLLTGSGPNRGHTSQSVTGRSTPSSTDTLAGGAGRASAGGALSFSGARQAVLLQCYAALDRMRAAVAAQPPPLLQHGLQQQQPLLVRQGSLPAAHGIRMSGVGDTQDAWPPPHSRLLLPSPAVELSSSSSLAGPGLLPHWSRKALWAGGDAGQGQLRRSVSLPALEWVVPEGSRGSTRQPQQQQQQEGAFACAWDSALPTANSSGPPGSLVPTNLVDIGVGDASTSRGSKLGAAVASALRRASLARRAGANNFGDTDAGESGFRPLGEQAGASSPAAAVPAAAAAAAIPGTTPVVVTIDLSALGGSGTVDLLAELGRGGRGGQGVVYRGRWKGLDVAVKCCLFHTVGRTACSPDARSQGIAAGRHMTTAICVYLRLCLPALSVTSIPWAQCLALHNSNLTCVVPLHGLWTGAQHARSPVPGLRPGVPRTRPRLPRQPGDPRRRTRRHQGCTGSSPGPVRVPPQPRRLLHLRPAAPVRVQAHASPAWGRGRTRTAAV